LAARSTDRELLQPRLLTPWAPGLGLTQVENDVLAFEALDRRGQNFLFAVGVFVENGLALRLAHLLEDHLFGQLRSDAAQRAGVPIEADFAAHFDTRRQGAGLGQRDLIHRVLDLLLVGHHGLEDVGGDLAGFLVELSAHVLLRLVVLARGQCDGLFHGSDDNLGLDALLAAQEFDALVQHAGHTVLALSGCSGGGAVSQPLPPS
jgi:hypothetical protein